MDGDVVRMVEGVDEAGDMDAVATCPVCVGIRLGSTYEAGDMDAVATCPVCVGIQLGPTYETGDMYVGRCVGEDNEGCGDEVKNYGVWGMGSCCDRCGKRCLG